jgi:hypothetical protein
VKGQGGTPWKQGKIGFLIKPWESTTAEGVSGQRSNLLINVSKCKFDDFSENCSTASKGSVRRKTAEAVKNGMGGRLWKQSSMSGRGKTPGGKVEGGTGFKTWPRGKVVHQGTLARQAFITER